MIFLIVYYIVKSLFGCFVWSVYALEVEKSIRIRFVTVKESKKQSLSNRASVNCNLSCSHSYLALVVYYCTLFKKKKKTCYPQLPLRKLFGYFHILINSFTFTFLLVYRRLKATPAPICDINCWVICLFLRCFSLRDLKLRASTMSMLKVLRSKVSMNSIVINKVIASSVIITIILKACQNLDLNKTFIMLMGLRNFQYI